MWKNCKICQPVFSPVRVIPGDSCCSSFYFPKFLQYTCLFFQKMTGTEKVDKKRLTGEFGVQS